MVASSLRLPKNITTVREYFAYLRSYEDAHFKLPSRDGYDWGARARKWRDDGNEVLSHSLDPYATGITNFSRVLPIFPSMLKRAKALVAKGGIKVEHGTFRGEIVSRPHTEPAVRQDQNTQENTMLDNAKETLDTVVDQNKEAAKLSAKLGVGRAANEFITAKLKKTLPFYKRWFIGNDLDWLGKLAVAQVTNAAIQHTSENEKLRTIGDAMLQESVVESTVYSDKFSDLIKGLEEAVSSTQLNRLLGTEEN